MNVLRKVNPLIQTIKLCTEIDNVKYTKKCNVYFKIESANVSRDTNEYENLRQLDYRNMCFKAYQCRKVIIKSKYERP